MIFSFTDLVISGTLLLNALTLVASKSSNIEHLDNELELNMNNNRENFVGKNQDTLPLMALSSASSTTSSSESGDMANSRSSDALSHMIRRIMVTIRIHSCIIAVWNILFMLLMLFVFRN